MTTKHLQAVFYAMISLCIAASVLSFVLFDFIELNVAVDWTMRYFALPIFVFTAPSCYFVYMKFIKYLEKKEYKSKYWNQLRTIFRVCILTFAMTFVFIGTTLSFIILSNAYFGESKTIHLNARIVEYKVLTRRNRIRHYIKIQDQQFDRIVELRVQKPYQVGQTFHKTMQIGYWGLLYSEE